MKQIFKLLSIALAILITAHAMGYAQQSDRKKGPGGKRGRRGGPREEMPEYPVLPKNDFEKKVMSVIIDMNKNQREGFQGVPLADGRLLRLFAESRNAKNIIEIGTSNGNSALWFCLALKASGGRLITHDIDPDRIKVAKENFKRAGVADMITIVMGDAHETVKKLKDPIDILFLDADKSGYIDYLKKLLPLVKPGGLIMAHNVANARKGMGDFIKAVTTDKNLDTVFLHMDRSGVSVTIKKR